MNSIVTTKLLSGKHQFAGRSWFYKFREIPNLCEPTKFNASFAKIDGRYLKITKQWSAERNSEWICRTYLSAKMIMSATLQLLALEHAKGQNLRIVAPYLEYYAILSLLRAIVYTLPEVEWKNGELAAISHRKAINLAFSHVALFNGKEAEKLKELTHDLKANRELISYRSPSSGDKDLVEYGTIIPVAELLAELAQINSELLEISIHKNADERSFVFLDDYADKLTSITIEDRLFFDNEDYYRLGYLMRKYPLPPNILHTMTEGHVEDFFGAWVSEEDGGFDPDTNWQLIFDIP
jgi:hypothetical protein